MKSLFLLLLLVPFLAISQVEDEAAVSEYLLHENELLTPSPTHLTRFREGLQQHNEEFHSEAPYGVRVYHITGGPNSGKYMSVMGPFPWSALDSADDREEHHEDWETNVQPYLQPGSNTSFWRLHPEMSVLSEDFEVDKLLVRYYDVKAYQEDRMMKLIDMLGKVMKEKFPEIQYATYTNILPYEKEGKDVALVFFFDDYAWLGKDPDFKKAYQEFYGIRGLEEFLADWQEVNLGEESEIWVFDPELSGIGSTVEVDD